jgi:hypothetical protein
VPNVSEIVVSSIAKSNTATRSNDMGYTVLPDIDRSVYTDLSSEGLEGPFVFKTGAVLYYDPREGKYYDRRTDMFVSDKDMLVHYGLVEPNYYNPRREI